MAWENYRRQQGLLLLLSLLIAGVAAPAWAQAPAAGDGLKANYYNGVNFDQLVLSRRDARIAFDWAHRPPVPGLPAEYFSVRWTGWLRPPASGRYLFHVTVDDGVRIWLNDELVLNEWRPQPVRRFTAAIELKAGQAYQLRVDYFQDILDTRALLTWERPDQPLAPPPASWRNLWGAAAATPVPEAIPTQYLFTHDPSPATVRVAVPAPPPPLPIRPAAPTRPAVRQPVITPAPRTRQRPTVARPREVAAPMKPLAATPVPVPAIAARPASVLMLADSGSAAQLARLAVGETVTLPELYFDQGQAALLPATRAALDGLAAALHRQPVLYLEVQGHTDNVGNAALNRQLSQQRAEAVCRYLVAHGVATGQLRPMGYGGTQPVADNAAPAQRPRNRRVVLRRL